MSTSTTMTAPTEGIFTTLGKSIDRNKYFWGKTISSKVRDGLAACDLSVTRVKKYIASTYNDDFEHIPNRKKSYKFDYGSNSTMEVVGFSNIQAIYSDEFMTNLCPGMERLSKIAGEQYSIEIRIKRN